MQSTWLTCLPSMRDTQYSLGGHVCTLIKAVSSGSLMHPDKDFLSRCTYYTLYSTVSRSSTPSLLFVYRLRSLSTSAQSALSTKPCSRVLRRSSERESSTHAQTPSNQPGGPDWEVWILNWGAYWRITAAVAHRKNDMHSPRRVFAIGRTLCTQAYQMMIQRGRFEICYGLPVM